MSTFLLHGDKQIHLVDELVIGRKPEGHTSHLVVSELGVSKKHCRIYLKGADWIIEDLDSDNGTFVNDKLVIDARKLVANDIIRLGPANAALWTATFVIEEEQPPPPPPPPVLVIDQEAHERERRLRSDLSALSSRCDALASELETKQRALEETMQNLAAELDEHRRCRLALIDERAAVAAARERIESLAKYREDAAEQLASANSTLIKLRQTQAELKAVQDRYAELEEKLEIAERKIKTVLDDHSSIAASYELLVVDREEMHTRLQDLESENQALRDEIVRLTNLATKR